jgi:hypothetical protein
MPVTANDPGTETPHPRSTDRKGQQAEHDQEDRGESRARLIGSDPAEERFAMVVKQDQNSCAEKRQYHD